MGNVNRYVYTHFFMLYYLLISIMICILNVTFFSIIYDEFFDATTLTYTFDIQLTPTYPIIANNCSR